MLEVFAFIGMFMIFTGIIFGLSALSGWMTDSDDYSGNWIVSTVLAGAFLTLFYMQII